MLGHIPSFLTYLPAEYERCKVVGVSLALGFILMFLLSLYLVLCACCIYFLVFGFIFSTDTNKEIGWEERLLNH